MRCPPPYPCGPLTFNGTNSNSHKKRLCANESREIQRGGRQNLGSTERWRLYVRPADPGSKERNRHDRGILWWIQWIRESSLILQCIPEVPRIDTEELLAHSLAHPVDLEKKLSHIFQRIQGPLGLAPDLFSYSWNLVRPFSNSAPLVHRSSRLEPMPLDPPSLGLTWTLDPLQRPPSSCVLCARRRRPSDMDSAHRVSSHSSTRIRFAGACSASLVFSRWSLRFQGLCVVDPGSVCGGSRAGRLRLRL